MASVLAIWPAFAVAETIGPNVSAILSAAEGASVLVIGEVHDNPAHHRIQADVLRFFEPRAVVFEMLGAEDARVLNARLGAGDLLSEVAMAELLAWERSFWPDFSIYAPIFMNLQSLPGPVAVYGAEVDREAAQDAFGDGAAAVFGANAGTYGLDRPLPEAEQDARETEQFIAHCEALPLMILPGFVEAQRLRDARLAEAVVRALDETGGPVMVITGNGHARSDWGVPAVLGSAAPEVRVVSVGQLEAVEADPPFDVWILTDPVERDDPCAAFAN